MKKTGEIVKELLEVKKMNQSDLARALETSTQDVSQKLVVNKDMKAQEFVRYLDRMGFDLIIKERKGKVVGFAKNIKNF